MQDAKPKFEHRDRSQVYLGPVDLDALSGADHAARGIWELLGTLDFFAYESQMATREGQAGPAATPPRLLAAIWIDGYSLGTGSVRAARLCPAQSRAQIRSGPVRQNASKQVRCL